MVKPLAVTPYSLAEAWVGLEEVAGSISNPFILGMLRMHHDWPGGDEVAWCSAFAAFICRQLRMPYSKSLAARSWLGIGWPVELSQAEVGFDIAVLWRGNREGPSGHVGFYGGHDAEHIRILGGNQSDSVCLDEFPLDRLLQIRRLVLE